LLIDHPNVMELVEMLRVTARTYRPDPVSNLDGMYRHGVSGWYEIVGRANAPSVVS
jgi:hypothetical protein